MGGIRIGSRNNTVTSFLPGKFRRASAYAVGTPITTDSTTTATATSNVTTSTSSRFISAHAVEYHDAVSPAGHQVPNHWVANEFTTTDATSPNRLTRKNATAPHTSHADSFIPCL